MNNLLKVEIDLLEELTVLGSSIVVFHEVYHVTPYTHMYKFFITRPNKSTSTYSTYYVNGFPDRCPKPFTQIDVRADTIIVYYE